MKTKAQLVAEAKNLYASIKSTHDRFRNLKFDLEMVEEKLWQDVNDAERTLANIKSVMRDGPPHDQWKTDAFNKWTDKLLEAKLAQSRFLDGMEPGEVDFDDGDFGRDDR